MDRDVHLSPREREALTLAAQGLTEKEIASELRLSRHTIHDLLAQARAKLHVDNTIHAVTRALSKRLIDYDDNYQRRAP